MIMGLGIRLSAAPPNGSYPGAVLRDVRDSIDAFVTDPLERMMLAFVEAEDSLAVHLHPAAGPVIFRASEDALTAQGDTSSAGPGYHAWLVDLLQDMDWRTGISWDWTNADDTQYQKHRDFARLREQALNAAAEFFAAWDDRDCARYWLGRGMASAWLTMRWVSPASEEEEALYKATLGCFARAREIDPDIALPEEEAKEIWTLLNDGGEDGPPAPWGTGFRRVATIRRFGNGWRANIPGFYLRETPHGLDVTVFSFGASSIHLATVPNLGGEESAEYLIEQKKKEAGENMDAFTFENGGVFGWAESTPSSPYRNLSGILSGGDETCFVTIEHEDTELQRDWAEKILRGITRDDLA